MDDLKGVLLLGTLWPGVTVELPAFCMVVRRHASRKLASL